MTRKTYLARWVVIAGFGLATIVLPATASAAQMAATWVGPGGTGGDGNWATAANWSPAVVPNNGTPAGTTYSVVIDGGLAANSNVNISSSALFAVDALTVSAGDTLAMTFSGHLVVVNSGPDTGTIVNAGNILLGAPGQASPGLLIINGDVTLSGGGTVTMSAETISNSIAGLTGAPGPHRLTNVDNTISGSGRIGGREADALTVINQSLILANQTRALTIGSHPNPNGVINTGTFRADAGGTLILDTQTNITVGIFDNTGGLIRANGGIVQVNLAAVAGGTVDVVGAGEILLANGRISGGTLTNSATGTIRSRFGSTNTIGGTVTNPAGGLIILERAQGTLNLLGGAGNSYTNAGDIVWGTGSGECTLTINGEVSLTGGGKVTMSNNNTNAINGSPSTSHLTNVDNTISGAGQIGGAFGGSSGTMRLTNQGTIIADQTSNLVINVTPSETGFTTSGTVQVNAGSTMLVESSDVFTQTAGSTFVNGTLTLNGGTALQLQGGILGGTGTIAGGVNNTAGTVAPGLSAGKLTVTGNYIQTCGTLAIEIGGLTTPGTDFDQLAINGNATLGGTLRVTNINGFTPSAGDTVPALIAGSISGAFSSANAEVTYGANGITVAAASGAATQLLNIATRMRVLTGENVLIGGFIITGCDPKQVIIRGIGPSLSGVGESLPDPTLELHQGESTLATNDNWKEHQAEVEATTIPPTNDLESAIVTTLDPGFYTAILADKNGASGVGVVEVYDLTAAAASKLANISTRGFVDTGDNVMIGGLILGGGSSGRTTRVLVRAIGPSLSGAGIQGALQDTTLELRGGDGALLASNDDWKSDQQSEIEDTTIPPTNDKESAIVATLASGNYTAIVRGKNGTTGVAVVEGYNLE